MKLLYITECGASSLQVKFQEEKKKIKPVLNICVWKTCCQETILTRVKLTKFRVFNYILRPL